MKKTLWIVAAATALLASCAKDATVDLLPAPEASDDFMAVIPEMRTELGDGNAVLWNENDQLTIFSKTMHNRKYGIKECDGRNATFTYLGYTGESSQTISSNYALYPYDEKATLSFDNNKAVIKTSIKTEQVHNSAKVDLANALMVAKSDDNTLQFVNAGALIRFNVLLDASLAEMPDTYTLKSIALTSNLQPLSGQVLINADTDSKAVVASDGAYTVTLTVGEELSAESAYFYMALPPVAFAEDELTLTFNLTENGVEKVVVKELPAFELRQSSIKTVTYTIKGGDFSAVTPGYEEIVSVTNSEELVAAIQSAPDTTPTLIKLQSGNYDLTDINITSKKDITIEGVLPTEVARSTMGTTLNSQVMVTGKLTLKNLTVTGPFQTWDKVSQFSKTAVSLQNAGKVVAEQVVFDMKDCISDATAISAWWSTQDGANITLKHCVFNCYGQRPIRSDASVTVEDCTFNDPYRYAVQLTSKSSTMNPNIGGVMNFYRNTINAGTTTTKPVYGVQLEGSDYGCYELTINGAGNVINLGTTGKESAMYYCECGKVDHASIVWNTEVEPVHEKMKVHAESGLWYNGNDERGKGVFYIFNEEEFQKAAGYFTGQTHTSEANSCVVEVMDDLDFAGMEYKPWSVMWVTFNCNNHTIANVSTTDNWRGGVFGYLGACKVNDLTLKNIKVSGAQVGVLAGSVEGVTTSNVKIEGENEVKYVAYSSDSYTETWGGIGAVTGIVSNSTINAEIVSGATVSLDTNQIVTEAPFQDVLTGYLEANKGAVVLNGELSCNVSDGQVMMSAIKSGVSEIYLSGEVELDGSRGNFITAGDNLVIKGNGENAKILGVGSTGEHQVQSMLESGNITFEGITFNVPALSSGWAMSSNISKTAKVKFIGCTFVGVQCPIYLSGGDTVVEIEGCKFNTEGCAIQAEVYSGDFQLGQDLIITNCDFGNCADVLHIYDYDKDPSSEAIVAYLTENGNIFKGTCKQTCDK